MNRHIHDNGNDDKDGKNRGRLAPLNKRSTDSEFGDKIGAHDNHASMPNHGVDANADAIGKDGTRHRHHRESGNQAENGNE